MMRFTDPQAGGAVWDSISYNVSGGQAIRSIALAPSDENYIYASIIQ